MQQIISANRLTDGLVVYLGAYGEWVTDIAAATVFDTEEGREAAKAKAQHALTANFIIDPLVVDITDGGGARRATTLRNTIRAQGPTINFRTSSPTAESARG